MRLYSFNKLSVIIGHLLSLSGVSHDRDHYSHQPCIQARQDALDPALKLLVGFNLLDIIASAIVETLPNLVGNGRLRQGVSIQTRSRQGHFLLHGLPEIEQARAAALHTSG